MTPMDARALLAEATAQLAAAGVQTPRVDAELLLAHLLGVPRSALVTRALVAESVRHRYTEVLARRATREPLQHIVGSAAFRHIELAVGPGVFIPRPETELLVDLVLAAIRGTSAPIVVDLCSGSGAIALAIVDERPDARVVAVEADGAALAWLRRNAEGTAVDVHAGDVTDAGLLREQRGTADVVVSNPPYVPETTSVSAEVLADPRVAVFGGPNGLELLPSVVARAAELLRADGLLAVEHDDTHADDVPRILTADGRWREPVGKRDLTGRPRFTTAIRSATAT